MKPGLTTVAFIVGMIAGIHALIGAGLLFTISYDRRANLPANGADSTITAGLLLLAAGVVGLIAALFAQRATVLGAILTMIMGVLSFAAMWAMSQPQLSIFCLPIGLAAFILFKART